MALKGVIFYTRYCHFWNLIFDIGSWNCDILILKFWYLILGLGNCRIRYWKINWYEIMILPFELVILVKFWYPKLVHPFSPTTVIQQMFHGLKISRISRTSPDPENYMREKLMPLYIIHTRQSNPQKFDAVKMCWITVVINWMAENRT